MAQVPVDGRAGKEEGVHPSKGVLLSHGKVDVCHVQQTGWPRSALRSVTYVRQRRTNTEKVQRDFTDMWNRKSKVNERTRQK